MGGDEGVIAPTILTCPFHGDPKGIGTSSSLIFDGHFCSAAGPVLGEKVPESI